MIDRSRRPSPVTTAFGILFALAAAAVSGGPAVAVDERPAATVALVIDANIYARVQARLPALVQILVHQPGAKRIVAYAVGSGDHDELWDSEQVIAPKDAASVERNLRDFVQRNAGNPGLSLSRIIDRTALALRQHVTDTELRQQPASEPSGDNSARLRLLIAVQEIDPLFRSRPGGLRTFCSPGTERSGWIDGRIRLGEFQTRGGRKQEAAAFWVYDARDRDPKQVNRHIEGFLHAGLARDRISFRGVYYLQESTHPPREPRGDPNPRPCTYLQELAELAELDDPPQDDALLVRPPEPQSGTVQSGGTQQPQQTQQPRQPQQPQQTPTTQPQVRPPDPRILNCQSNQDMVVVDQYVAGKDLPPAAASKLYAAWDRVDCHVWTIIGTPGRPSFERGRALRLLRLAVARSSGGYWQPQAGQKKARRDFSRSLPYLRADDYQTFFEFVQSDDATLRDEARTFIRTFPVDAFERLFDHAYGRRNELGPDGTEWLAMAAASFYYNRIVEYLDEPAANTAGLSSDQKTRANAKIRQYLEQGLRWTADSLFVGKNGKAHEAMLRYAVAITEREKDLQPDQGRQQFAAMLAALRDGTLQYPTNPVHIAQALAITEAPGYTEAILKKAAKFEPLQGLFLDQAGLAVGTTVDLFVGPGDQYPRQNVQLEVRSDIRVLLRSDDWYLAQSKGAVGWILRQ